MYPQHNHVIVLMLHDVYLNKLDDPKLSNFDCDSTMLDSFLLRLFSPQLGLTKLRLIKKKVGQVKSLGLTIVTNQLLVI